MAHYSLSRSLVGLLRGTRAVNSGDPLMQCLAPRYSRGFASQTELPVEKLAGELDRGLIPTPKTTPNSATTSPSFPQALTTLYTWPDLEPTRYAFYNHQLLNVPLRRDILHRAVIYEADNSRQGTAHVKWRGEVHGSNRKIAPQKGTGRARVGDKKSPIRRGGGKAFGPTGTGPNAKNFRTDLNRKVYDLAFRTALSYRHRKGELIIIDGQITSPQGTGGRFLANVFEAHSWGKGHGGGLLITEDRRERLFNNMETIGEHGLVKDLLDIDVKDLLEKGRLVIEKEAFDSLLVAHMSDLGRKYSLEHALQYDKDELVHADGLLTDGRKGSGLDTAWEAFPEIAEDDGEEVPLFDMEDASTEEILDVLSTEESERSP